MIKRYRYRAYPTKEQDKYFQQIFGSCRFVYNWGRGRMIMTYDESKRRGDEKPKGLSVYDVSKELTDLKKNPEYMWLNDVPSVCLNWSLQHLDNAFKNFYRMPQAGFPVEKKKFKSQKAFSYHQGYKIAGNRITAPKSGWVKFVKHREWNGDTKTITVVQEPSGKYYVSMVVDNHLLDTDIMSLDMTKTVGIDVGVVNTLTLSDGMQFHLDIDLFKEEKRILKLSRNLSRKKLGSSNFGKAKKKLALKHEEIRHKRENRIKEVVFELVCYLKDKGYCGLSIRKYDIKSMVDKDKVEKDDNGKAKHGKRYVQRKLNKKIMGGCMGMIFTQIKQKCAENGLNFVEMDAGEEKTTAKCSKCGSERVKISLKKRTMKCLNCGHKEDIDSNASKNIKDYTTKRHGGKGFDKNGV